MIFHWNLFKIVYIALYSDVFFAYVLMSMTFDKIIKYVRNVHTKQQPPNN